MTVILVPAADTHIYFSLTCITAPVFGALLSGVAGSKFGGFDSVYAIPSCMFFGIISVISAIFVPMSNDFKVLILLIWIMLFCGGYILPITTGVMLNSVENNLRPQANSMANFCYNLFGYLPAPAIYGAVCSMTGGKQSKWGMIILMYMTIPSIIFLSMAWVYSTRQKKSKDAFSGLYKDDSIFNNVSIL